MQLRRVILMCSSTCMRMAAPGMRRFVKQQLRVSAWMCSGGRSRTAALTRSMITPGQLSNLLDWLDPPHRCHYNLSFHLFCLLTISGLPYQAPTPDLLGEKDQSFSFAMDYNPGRPSQSLSHSPPTKMSKTHSRLSSTLRSEARAESWGMAIPIVPEGAAVPVSPCCLALKYLTLASATWRTFSSF